MRRTLSFLAIGAGLFTALPVAAQTPAQSSEVTLTRIDCGTGATPTAVAERFTDTFAHANLKLTFTFSCYLVKHGSDYMVWDTGFAPGSSPNAPKVGLAQRLAEVNVKPEQVKYVGISHYHADHTGQLAPFAQATLLIGKEDWAAITAPTPAPGVNAAGFTDWTKGGRKLEIVPQDKDVFGDGTVLMLNTPGHTPGHKSLLVRLKQTGPVLLTGDLAHFHENYETGGVPSFNTDRGQTLASLDRFKKAAANLKALVVIQHDQRDIAKLPAFPNAAK